MSEIIDQSPKRGRARKLLTGKYGRLTPISDREWVGKRAWFRCDCGKESLIYRGNVENGDTRSCGCLWAENDWNRTHGMTRTGTYGNWRKIRALCGNPSSPQFPLYGGRGIKVCERWLAFKSFHADMGEQPASGYGIERVDDSKDFEPGNCFWAPRAPGLR